MRRRLAVAVALAVGLTGCLWEAPGNGPHRNAFNQTEHVLSAENVGRLEEVWSLPTDGSAARFPIVSGEAVHVVDDSHLYGIEKATGEVLWRFDAPGGTTIGPAFDLGDDGLIVGTGPWEQGPTPGYSTYHVEPATGAVTDPNKADGWVVGMGPFNYLVERFNRGGDDPALPVELHYEHVDFMHTGRSWSRRIYVAPAGAQAPSSPSIGYFVYQAGQGPLVDASGLFVGAGNALRGYFTTSAPTGPCNNGRLPIACPAWSTPLDGTRATSPVLAERGEQVFTGTDAGTLYAIDGAPLGSIPTATVLWQAPVGAAVTESPARAYETIYVPTADGDLVAVDEATGEVLWSGATGSSIDVQPAVGGGLVFTASADGTLHAFDADGCGGATTCPALWSLDTGDSAITGAPAISEGRLFVGTADGRLLAFGLVA